ncbi:hypothetical protein AGMMS50267_17540 [Spirochaetia bacterium]|nr:hypothetical protein AGMMS50267_17540 [Spirochaetia bacterium]
MNSKNNIIRTVLPFVSICFLLVGCADPASGELNEVYKYPKTLWGEWIRMDTGAEWYITSNYLRGSTSSNITLSRQSNNVIEVTDNGKKYYLYASRIPNGSFRGKIVGYDDDARSISRAVAGGKGFIKVVIEDLNDKANSTTSTTDGDGNFTADGIIPGDEYEVTVGGETTTVTPNTNGEDVGTVTITSGVNFKTSITSGSDLLRLYANNTEYSFSIKVTNTGSTDCLAATFDLTFDAGITIVSQPSSLILGTIEPGKSKTIPIIIKCSSISDFYEYKKISVTITDQINNKTWDDSVSLKFNKENVAFQIKSNSAVSGIIIVPTGKAYAFKTTGSYSGGSYSASVAVPRYSKDYLVVFSGAIRLYLKCYIFLIKF